MNEQVALRIMNEDDVKRVIPLYMDYYNNHEDCCWTEEKAFKRIHQAFAKEDSLCIIAEEGGIPVGFAVGFFRQYDDLSEFLLDEIVVKYDHQGHGIGTMIVHELEKRAIANGSRLIELTAVNDDMHHHFYEKLGFGYVTNLIGMSKWIGDSAGEE